jgi:macrodomain Ter protein organizer (MatP/YcbG family)
MEKYKSVKLEYKLWLKLKQLALDTDESLQAILDKKLDESLRGVK